MEGPAGWLAGNTSLRGAVVAAHAGEAVGKILAAHEQRAPIAYEPARHGHRLTDATYDLPPMNLSRREVFSFSLARKMLHAFEGTPLEMRIETSGRKELVRWVLSWMPDVEVLTPQSLRDRVREKLRSALGSSATGQ